MLARHLVTTETSDPRSEMDAGLETDMDSEMAFDLDSETGSAGTLVSDVDSVSVAGSDFFRDSVLVSDAGDADLASAGAGIRGGAGATRTIHTRIGEDMEVMRGTTIILLTART
jgi:hypothetical protein